MDGKEDCFNGEDEKQPIECDNTLEFTCTSNGRCVPRHMVNDNFIDCFDGSDEDVDDFNCLDTEFDCQDGRCIPRWWVRNNIVDCQSGLDEVIILVNCISGEFACLDRSRCLPLRFICDGTTNCNDGSDEVELCDSPTFLRLKDNSTVPVEYLYWYYFFRSSQENINRLNQPLKGVALENLLTKMEEVTSSVSFAFGLKCIVNSTKLFGSNEFDIEEVSFSRLFVPQHFIQNNISICVDELSSCYDNNGTFKCTRCLDGHTVILKSQLCDDIIDCRDLSDECLCGSSYVEPLCKLMFNSAPKAEPQLTVTMICDGENNYADQLDERFCYVHGVPGVNLTGETNSRETINCKSSQIHAKFCDGRFECPNMEDECSDRCLQSLFSDDIVSESEDIFEVERSYRTLSTCSPQMHLPPVDWTSESHFERHDFEYEDLKITSLLKLDLSRKYFRLNRVVDGSSKKISVAETVNLYCDHGGLVCPWKHRCVKSNISIEFSQVCDLKIDCPNGTDELGCSDETHFYCKDDASKFIAKSRHGDGKKDCVDNSDECIVDAFSDEYEMIKNRVLRNFVWVAAVLSLLSNMVVICQHFTKLRKITDKKSSLFCNTLLLTNLAFSDMLMGVSLLVVAVKSAEYSGSYCQKTYEWRTSPTCNFVGAMTIISSQTSMNCLVLLIGFRLLIVNKPLFTLRLRYLYSWIAFVWVLSLAYALIPILKTEHFARAYLIEENEFYAGNYVDRFVVDKNYERIEALFRQFKMDSKTGGVLIDDWLMKFPELSLNVQGYFGYYSSNSVCFPNFYSTYYPALPLSFTILLNNFCALICALLQIEIVPFSNPVCPQLA